MKRHAIREIVLKVLYAWDVGKNDPEMVLKILWEEEKQDEAAENFGRQIIEGVVANIDELDKMLKAYTIEWDLKRMAAIDRNIMRMALFEMFYSHEIPRAIVLNEAIELGKKYGGLESSRFINGILGKINSDLTAKEEESKS